MTSRLVLTCGEPAGIGPDVVLGAALCDWPVELLAVGSHTALAERSEALGLDIELIPFTSGTNPSPHKAGTLRFLDVPLSAPCVAGELDTRHGSAVLASLELAVSLCQADDGTAMVTGPVHKGVINDTGIPFSGHTEFLASLCGTEHVVMMLASPRLRVALATTHLPLRAVPDAIEQASLTRTIEVIHQSLQSQWGIASPRISVLGLNPHAGEGGYLGDEEIRVIEPVTESLREKGLAIRGPLPADTAFSNPLRKETDVYLAMYHDQGLTVLKSEGFGEAVNVTLGLPIIRTSVDHGVALDLAGTGRADDASMKAAIEMAIQLASKKT